MTKKGLFLLVLQPYFITLINLNVQTRGTQTRYTVVHFGHDEPLRIWDPVMSMIKLFYENS